MVLRTLVTSKLNVRTRYWTFIIFSLLFVFSFVSLKEMENLVQVSSSTEWCDIGVPYLAVDGLTVTLNSFTIVEKIGSYQYQILYTLENNGDDKVLEGTFKMYYQDSVGGLPQYGFFNYLFPGDTLVRGYTFEEIKSQPFDVLGYHHDHFFLGEPLEDSLKWKVEIPDNAPPLIETITQEPKIEEVESFENVLVWIKVTDSLSGVERVILSYTINEGIEWTNLAAIYNTTSGFYESTIPGTPLGTVLKYQIIAYDNAGNSKVEDNNGQYYVYIVLHKISTALSCSVLPSTIKLGDSINIIGSISPPVTGATVTLSIKHNEGSWNMLTTVTSSSSYTYSWTPETLGSYKIKASWNGMGAYEGAISNTITVNVTKISTTISCSVSQSDLTIGDSFNVSGSIIPALAGKTVTITYTKPDGSTVTRTSTTNPGDYSDAYIPDILGSWSVTASWDGDAIHEAASSASQSFSVSKILTSVTCSTSSSEINLEDSITVSGAIDLALSDKTVTFTYTKPDDSTVTRTVTTGSDGSYSDTYTPDADGSWSVTATWAGDSMHDGSSSSLMSFIVKKSGCLIATATYGSELSPQIQFLRGFRDNTVYSTFAGSSFMTVFNGFYYSFSPNVASVIADNSALRGIMKVVLYPLIGILQVSSAAFSVFSFLPELGIIVAGLIASALIGIIYFLPLALIVSLKKKFKVSEKIIRLLGLIWIGSVLTVVIAEIFQAPSMMMLSTGAFVLVTIATATLISLRIVSKHLIH